MRNSPPSIGAVYSPGRAKRLAIPDGMSIKLWPPTVVAAASRIPAGPRHGTKAISKSPKNAGALVLGGFLSPRDSSMILPSRRTS